jgi:uncharacterized membrane protein YidH (DUF202 family)
MDIRMPIGLLFSIIGVIITIYGFITKGSEMYRHSLYININLYSGVCLLVFGLIMTFLALGAQKKTKI